MAGWWTENPIRELAELLRDTGDIVTVALFLTWEMLLEYTLNHGFANSSSRAENVSPAPANTNTC